MLAVMSFSKIYLPHVSICNHKPLLYHLLQPNLDAFALAPSRLKGVKKEGTSLV
jgi:hypothetical protein